MSADDDLRRAKCASKIAYESAGAARRVRQYVSKPHRVHEGPPVSVYRCTICDKFHLGRDYIAARKKPGIG